jgi:hypothetical protein
MTYFIGLCVLYEMDITNLFLFALLLLNSYVKEELIKDMWIRVNYPLLYKFLLYITSLITTSLIFYFLDCILVKLIMPFISKLWNFKNVWTRWKQN